MMMGRLLAIVAAISFLQAGVVIATEPPTSAEKRPAPPRTPETGIDPGIQVHPGPSPDPHTAIPPKHNPDPEMAINPDAIPSDPTKTRRLAPSSPNPSTRPPEAQPKKRTD